MAKYVMCVSCCHDYEPEWLHNPKPNNGCLDTIDLQPCPNCGSDEFEEYKGDSAYDGTNRNTERQSVF